MPRGHSPCDAEARSLRSLHAFQAGQHLLLRRGFDLVADKHCELSRMAESAAGVVVDAQSPEQLSGAIRELAGDRQRRREMGEQAQRFAGTYFDKQSALRVLESLIAS